MDVTFKSRTQAAPAPVDSATVTRLEIPSQRASTPKKRPPKRRGKRRIIVEDKSLRPFRVY